MTQGAERRQARLIATALLLVTTVGAVISK